MGYFYFDESIQDPAGFIIGAFVYAKNEITSEVFSAIEEVGLRPKVDEFKSSARMDRHPKQAELRSRLSTILQSTKIGLVVLPAPDRTRLGTEAIHGLQKILTANWRHQSSHEVFFDEGIFVDPKTRKEFLEGLGKRCQLHTSQKSHIVGGIQLADLVAHSLGGMLLEQLGLKSKMVVAGEGAGYEPDLEITLGFELWASLRYQFFMASQPKTGLIPDDPIGNMTFDVENYGLYISEGCSSTLREAVLSRFGENYLGCIH